MTDEKGLDPTVADKIGDYVKLKGTSVAGRRLPRRLICHPRAGGPELLRTLEADATLTSNPSAKQGISEMAILFRLLDAYQVSRYVGCTPFRTLVSQR
jgi:histidyl-tRNA synthetase